MDESQVELMAATQLTCHQVRLDSVTCNSWDTWEELLLASAVKKHGTDKWGLVSAELRDRASARNASPSTFTPEACRSEYYVLRGRYGQEDREGDLSDDLPWLEELRKLRVAQLKRELEHFDNSIGFLKIKLERLQSEREKSLHIRCLELGETAIRPGANEYKADTARSICSSDAFVSQTCGGRSDDLFPGSQEAFGDVPGYSKLDRRHPTEEERQSQVVVLQGTGPEKVEEELKITESTLERSEGIPLERDVSQSMQVKSSAQHRCALDAGIERGVVNSMEQSHSCPCEGGRGTAVCLSNAEELGADISVSVETLAGSREIGLSIQTQKRIDWPNAVNEGEDRFRQKSRDLNAANGEEVRMSPEAENGEVGRIRCGRGSGAKPMVSQETPDVMDIKIGGEEREEFANLETQDSQPKDRGDSHSSSGTFLVSEGRSLPKFVVPARTPFSTLDSNQEGSETVNSPRLRHTVPLKHRRGTDGGIALKGSSDKEVIRLDDGQKTVMCRVLGDKSVPEHKDRMPIESADSTEDKQQEEVPPVSETKKSSDQATAVRKAKTQTLSSETGSKSAAAADIPKSRNCRELVMDYRPSNSDVKNSTTTSTEISEFLEVWGESAEVVDEESEPVRKKQRVTGWGKKRKSKKSITKDLASSMHEDTKGATNRAKETCVKMESMTASHEGRDSMHDREGNEADDHDMEAWHGMERFSSDSRVERSEVGSFVDGTEDISPMSRRNRREPKVSGKLMPLLDSLRTVVAHKFAHLFKHNQESQNNPRYDRLIRAHVDLGMIRARLEEGQYSGSLHFFRDLLLMVNNALVYYPRDTQEFAAATGLRECIVKEMEHVLETEALLKQQGPSIRKRDLTMASDAPKAPRQPPATKGEKRKGIRRRAANDLNTRGDTPMNSKEPSGVVTNVGSRDISGKENIALGLTEPTMPAKGTIETHDLQMLDTDAQMGAQHEALRGRKLADELRMGHLNTEPTVEVKEASEPGVRNAFNAHAKESKDRERRVDSRDRQQNKQGVLAKAARLSKASGIALSKGVETNAAKVRATRAQRPDISHEPVKRGVGRPPKHSQPHFSERVKDPEARRKLVRR